MFLTIFISNIISWVVLEAIFSIPPCSWVFLLNQDLHFKIHVQTETRWNGFFDPPEGCACQYLSLFLPRVAVGIPANLHTVSWGLIVFPHSWPEYFGLTQSWQGSAPWAALYPTVCGIALLGNRSGLLTPRWYNSPSDLFSFQKGTPLLVHPMLHSNVGLPLETPLL